MPIRGIEWCFVIVSFVAAVLSGVNGEGKLPAEKLMSTIFQNYDPAVIPRINSTGPPLKFTFGLALVNLLEVNEIEGFVKTQLWYRMIWNDLRLKWNESDYEGISVLRVPIEKLWVPDMVNYKAIGNAENLNHKAQALVYPTGEVLYVPSKEISTPCTTNTTYYPWNEVNCTFKYASWTYDGNQIGLAIYNDKNFVSMSDYFPHKEWTVQGFNENWNSKIYPCCDEPYENLSFNLRLKRRGFTEYKEAMTYNMALFATLIASLLIPPTSGAKIPFATLHLLLGTWMLWTLGNKFWLIKSRSEDGGGPLVSYFEANLILSTLNLFANIFTVMLIQRKGALPTWVSRVCCIEFPNFRTFMSPKEKKDSNEFLTSQLSTTEKKTECWESVAILFNRIMGIMFVGVSFILYMSILPSQEFVHLLDNKDFELLAI